MQRFAFGLTALIILLCGAADPAASQSDATATALAITSRVSVLNAAGVHPLERGGAVAMGDTIVTDVAGRAQLRFSDNTLLAIAPNTRLVIGEYLLSSDGAAQRLAISTLGGGFRFISGRSPSAAYVITTRTATIGIRGTAFDVADRDWGTGVVSFEGIVEVCQGGSCQQLRSACEYVEALAAGGGVSQLDENARNQRLRGDFDFVRSQGSLLIPFLQPVSTCGNIFTDLDLGPGPGEESEGGDDNTPVFQPSPNPGRPPTEGGGKPLTTK